MWGKLFRDAPKREEMNEEERKKYDVDEIIKKKKVWMDEEFQATHESICADGKNAFDQEIFWVRSM